MRKEQKELTKDMTSGSIFRQMLRFSLPLLFSGLLQTAYNIVDMAVVGKAVGSICLAGVSVGADVIHTLLFVSVGFSHAGQVIISQQIGAKQRDRVGKTVGNLLTFVAVVGIILSVICLIFRTQILEIMNTPPESWDYAWTYITVCFAGTVFIYGYNLISAVLRGMGDSRHPLIFIVIATVINVVLDLVCVYVFDLKAMGVALSTVIAQGVSFVLSIVFLYKKRHQLGFRLDLKCFVLKKDVLIPIVKLGVPMAFQNAMITVSRMFVFARINLYGVLATAITGMGNKFDSSVVVISNALSVAGASIIGQNIGAGKHKRVSRSLAVIYLFEIVSLGIMALILLLFPRFVFGLFVNEADVLECSMAYVPVAIVSLGGCMFRQAMMSLIYGSGNTKLNIVIAVLDGIIFRIGLALLMGEVFGMGISGYWYGNALTGYVPFFIGGIYYLSGRWKNSFIVNEFKEDIK